MLLGLAQQAMNMSETGTGTAFVLGSSSVRKDLLANVKKKTSATTTKAVSASEAIGHKRGSSGQQPRYKRSHEYNISICSSTSQSNKALLVEWLEYHRLLGVEHFFIYDTFFNSSSLYADDNTARSANRRAIGVGESSSQESLGVFGESTHSTAQQGPRGPAAKKTLGGMGRRLSDESQASGRPPAASAVAAAAAAVPSGDDYWAWAHGDDGLLSLEQTLKDYLGQKLAEFSLTSSS